MATERFLFEATLNAKLRLNISDPPPHLLEIDSVHIQDGFTVKPTQITGV